MFVARSALLLELPDLWRSRTRTRMPQFQGTGASAYIADTDRTFLERYSDVLGGRYPLLGSVAAQLFEA
jgi:hypothetical protein